MTKNGGIRIRGRAEGKKHKEGGEEKVLGWGDTGAEQMQEQIIPAFPTLGVLDFTTFRFC